MFSSNQARGDTWQMPRGDHIAVSISRGCPNSPNPCNCPGTCRRPVTDEEAIEALERKLREIKDRRNDEDGG